MKVKCPFCGSEDVTKLKTGSYRCNSCGIVFYPSEVPIIDMRDLVEADMLTEEEVNLLGEKIADVAEPIEKDVFKEEVETIFQGMSSLEDILSRYDENEKVFGIFIDFKGDVKGTLFVILPAKEMVRILEGDEDELVETLQTFGTKIAGVFQGKMQGRVYLDEIDIAYDNIPSMMNYLLSEVGKIQNHLLFNVRLMGRKTSKGEIIFVPQKDSVKSLKGLLRRDSL